MGCLVKGKTLIVMSASVRAVGIPDGAFNAVFCCSEREQTASVAGQWYTSTMTTLLRVWFNFQSRGGGGDFLCDYF